jgi:hypothetical protein
VLCVSPCTLQPSVRTSVSHNEQERILLQQEMVAAAPMCPGTRCAYSCNAQIDDFDFRFLEGNRRIPTVLEVKSKIVDLSFFEEENI